MFNREINWRSILSTPLVERSRFTRSDKCFHEIRVDGFNNFESIAGYMEIELRETPTNGL
jgi:hypothetical protein